VDSGDLLRVCKSPVADEFWRSAGPVLRSQGTWGRVGLSRWRARGNRVWTFQCSLWTDPAPLGVFWRSAGSVLRSLRKLWRGLGFRAARWGFWCSPPRLAADRSRSAWRMGRSAGSVLRSLRRLREGWGFRAVREGFLLFASKARCGPIPLRLAYGALRGIDPSLAEEALGRMGFSRCTRGVFVVRLQGSLRTDPASLGRVLALRGIGPALAEEALGRMGFSRCARGDFGVRLQGSLRTDPASLGVFWRSAGSILHSLRRLRGGWGFRAVREGFWCSPPRLTADRSRSAGRIWGLRGIGPTLAEEARGRMGLSRFARGALVIASKARSGPVPLRFAYLGRSAGSGLRSLRRLWGGWSFRALREGVLLFASKARCGPIPLRWAF
jgi:hypothetical protein